MFTFFVLTIVAWTAAVWSNFVIAHFIERAPPSTPGEWHVVLISFALMLVIWAAGVVPLSLFAMVTKKRA